MPATLVWVRTTKQLAPQLWRFSPADLVTGYWDDLIVASKTLANKESQLPLWELAEKYPAPKVDL